MVEAGQLSIKGSIDTSMIERGFAKIKKALERVKSGMKSFASDMVRIGQSSAKFSKEMKVWATVGLAAIIGLAKSAPAVAPAMAKIGVEFGRLSRIIGQQLQPFFNTFADAFTRFVSFVDAHPNLTKGFALGAAALVGITAMTKLVTALSLVASPSMLAALGILAAMYGVKRAGDETAQDFASGAEKSEAGSITFGEQFTTNLATQTKNAPALFATGGLSAVFGTIMGVFNYLDNNGLLMAFGDAFWGGDD